MPEDNDKLKIQKSDLRTIIDAGHSAFNEAESFAGMVSSEIQAYLLLVGVDALLRSKGVEVPFEIDISTKRYK